MQRFRSKASKLFSMLAIGLLAFTTILPAFPQNIVYADTDFEVDNDEDGSIRNEVSHREYDRATIDKRVSRTGNKPGEYFIDLTIEGKSTEGLETSDIVLVYDNSNSMSNNNRVGIVRQATTDFVNGLLGETSNFQMGLITFGTVVFDGRPNTVYSGNTQDISYKNLTGNPNPIIQLLPSDTPNVRGRGNDGGTFTQDGLREAGKVLANSTADNKIIVTLTDGVPTVSYDAQGTIQGNGTNFFYDSNRRNHGDNTIREANGLKEAYELYTIGIKVLGDADASREQANTVLRGISSSPNHTYNATEVSQVVDYLNEISANLRRSIVNGSVTDPMGEMLQLIKGPNGMSAATSDQLTDGDYCLSASDPALLENVNVSLDGQTINMNGLYLGENETVQLRYKVQLDTEHPNFEVGTFYNTNGDTLLTPRDLYPEESYLFPEPAVSANGIAISGEKFWDDSGFEDQRPDEIEILLLRDVQGTPTEIDKTTVSPDNDGSWKYEFTNQIKFDSQGNSIDYYVQETEVPGYETNYEANRLDVTNILIPNPEISLKKEANRDDLVVGEEIEYTFTVENTGSATLHQVYIEDELENISDIEYLTINGQPLTINDPITLQPKDIMVATASYTITQEDVDRGQVINYATVTGTSPDDETVTDDDEARVPQELTPRISLIKASDLDSFSEVGETVRYTFDVTNTGNVTLSNIQLDDPMLGGEITLETTTLIPGESTTGLAEYVVTQADLENGSIDNIATVTAEDPTGTPVEDEDEDELPGNQNPSISLIKEADRDDLVTGEKINYSFIATNNGNVTLSNVTIEDILEGLSDVRYLTINGESIDNTESITLKPGDVLAAEADYTITQQDVDNGQVVNEATVTGTAPNGENVTDVDDAQVTNASNPAIELEKTSNVEEVTEVGQIITYTFQVVNTGDVTLTDIVVNDPKISTDIELETTTLAPGESTSGTANYTVTEQDLEAGNLINTATATGNPPNPNDTPPVDEDEDNIPVGSIQLVKTSDVEAITEVGQEIIYTFEVTNTGKVPLNNVQVTDPLIGEDIVLASTTLEPGETTTGTASYIITQEDLDNERVVNIATTSGETPEGTEVEDEDEDVVNKASISLTKTSNVEEVTEVGEIVIYTFEVTNTGYVTLENVVVTDPMLGGAVELATTTLEPGETTTGTAAYIVTQADLNNGSIVNVATTTGETPGGSKVEDEDENTLPTRQTPDISLVKEADRDDLVVGEEITYTFTVTNTGNVTLNNTEITDQLEGLSDIRYLTINGHPLSETSLLRIVDMLELFSSDANNGVQPSITLQPGDELVAEATYVITQEDVDRGKVENTATVEGTTSLNEVVTDEDDEIVEHTPNPSISLEKTSDIEEVTEVGQVVTYTFEVVNTGDVTLTDIELTDPLLGGAIHLATTTLAPGEATTATASYEVTQADVNRGEIINVANVEGTPPNHNPDDPKPSDEDEVRVPASQNPSISLVKEVDRENLVVGEALTYTFTATNTGNVTLTEVVITDELEGISEIRYLTINGEEIVEIDSITLQPGDELVAEATYTITQDDVDASEVANYATVTGLDPTGEVVTDDDEALVPHDPNPAISLVKTSDTEEVLEAGQVITYTFEVTNTGDVTLREIELIDEMLGGALDLETTTLAPGETTTATATYEVTQADVNSGVIVNVANVEGTPPNHNPDSPKPSDEDEVRVPVSQNPSISLEKSADRENLVVGEEIVYSFTATNTGNVTLTDVVITDELDGISEIRYLSINGEELEEFESITLQPGDALVAEATYTITQVDVDASEVNNHATVTGVDPIGEVVTDDDEAHVPHDPNPAISLAKTSNTKEVTEAGQVITYTFDVTNTGDVTLTDIVLTDPMLGGALDLETTTLAPGETTTATAAYEVSQSDINRGGEIVNKASVEGTPPNHNPDDPKPSDEDEKRVLVTQDPSISLEKRADRDNLVVEEDINYTFTATNTGNTTLTDVTLIDELAGLSEICYLSINGEEIDSVESITLEPGDELVAEASYTITQSDVDAGEVTNEATVVGTDPSGAEVTDEDTVVVPDTPNPSISLEKTSDLDKVTEAGQVITYTFDVTNTGNVSLNELELTDEMLGGVIELETSTLAPGETTTKTATYEVTKADLADEAINNTAVVNGKTQQGESVDDEDSDSLPIERVAAEKEARTDGEKLPKTATNLSNFLLIGFLLLLTGGTTLLILRKKKKKEA